MRWRAEAGLRGAMAGRLVWALLLTVPLGLVDARPVRGSDAPRPNIVVFLADDMGYYDVGFNGNPVIRTPSIDRFAAEGVILRAAYAGAPICSPSRVALLTGRFPSSVGIFDLVIGGTDTRVGFPKRVRRVLRGVRGGRMSLPESVTTVAEILRDEGYDTYHGGKWHVSDHFPRAGRRYGFRISRDFDRGMAWFIVGRARWWLERQRDPTRPFFMYLAPIEPHFPPEDRSPPPYRKPYETAASEAAGRQLPYRGCPRRDVEWSERTAYFGSVSQLDEAFGWLLEYLDDAGLRENTFIFFTSDNGPAMAQRAYGSAGPFSGCKNMLYEGGIRVPAAAQWPRGMKRGLVSEEVVHGVDLLPTLAELTGARLPDDLRLDGVSFLPALQGKPLERPRPLFWLYWRGHGRHGSNAAPGGMQAALRVDNWKLLGRFEPLRDDWRVMKYIERAEFDAFELYDLASDPTESRDLSESEPEVLERLKALMISIRQRSLEQSPRWDLEDRRHLAARKTAKKSGRS